MKRALFNLKDEEFATLLARTGKAFAGAGIKYMFVGGAAVQMHIAQAMTKIHNLPLQSISPEILRTQDSLRATDDLDMVAYLSCPSNGSFTDKVKYQSGKVYEVLDAIAGEGVFFSPGEDALVKIELIRRAHVRPVFHLGLDGARDASDRLLAFNINLEPICSHKTQTIQEFETENFQPFLNDALEVAFPYYGDATLSARVISAPDLFATKVVRGRPKDLSDAMNLALYTSRSGSPINQDYISHLLFSGRVPGTRPVRAQDFDLRVRYKSLIELMRSSRTD